MSSIREYYDFIADQQRLFEHLLSTAHNISFAVEREIQVTTVGLNTLALSESLQKGDFEGFAPLAQAFLARQDSGTALFVTKLDSTIQHIYTLPGSTSQGPIDPTYVDAASTSTQVGGMDGRSGFAISVPVSRDAVVAYHLTMRTSPRAIQDVIDRQYAPMPLVIAVADKSGTIVARVPGRSAYWGRPLARSMWSTVKSGGEGFADLPTLEGLPTLAAYTHILPSEWTVVVGEPKKYAYAAMREATFRLAVSGICALIAAVLFGSVAARGITRPISQLRRLATVDADIDSSEPISTGLPEADQVAQALFDAAKQRRQANEALAKSEQRFRAMFERSASGSVLIDPETLIIVDCNEAAAGFGNHLPEEVIGHHWTDFATVGIDRLRKITEDVLAGKILRYETQNEGRNGRRDLLVCMGPVWIGGRTLLLSTTIDITDLRKAEAQHRQATEALAESEQRFRALFERSPSGSVLADPETFVILDCNDAAAGFSGYTREEFIGHKLTDFATLNVEAVRKICNDVLAGKILRYETQIEGRVGKRNLLLAVGPVLVGGRTLLLSTHIDVSDLRRAEAVLRANEERLELARQGANLGIWDWDVTNDTLDWSEQEWRLHGLMPDPAGITPSSWSKTVDPVDLPRLQQELRSALRHPDRPYSTEYSIRLPDGSIRRLLGRGQASVGADGRVIRMVGINMDVTARYEAERARDWLIRTLENERKRLSEIIEALPIGVGIIGADGDVLMGNSRMQTLMGLTLTKRTEPVDPDSTDPIERALQLGETSLPGRDYLIGDSEGQERWIRIGALPLRQEDDKPREALAIFLDVDAEKRLLDIQQQVTAKLEQRVREEVAAREAAQQRAAHAERMHALGQIAGGIAHDFNNVLQAVTGSAALIERRPGDPERVARNARMVLDATKRGAAITGRLLAFARRGDLRAIEIDTAALLRDMAEVLSHTLGGSVVCRIDAPPGLPKLFADRGQLETVLVNMATNARDAMPDGGTLTLSAETDLVQAGVPHLAGLTEGKYVLIAVSDTGYGMDPVILSRVTEPFFTTKEPGKGTGLGLAMAKGFAEQSGGNLWIESVVDKGTRVLLWLPTATCAETQPLDDEAPRAIADRLTVLLVDDDPIVREVLTLSLEDAGYTVISEENGTAALARLGVGERVDIIVSDLSMPGVDGITLIRSAQERWPSLPAVLLTGFAGDGAAAAIDEVMTGAFSLLHKPASGPQLVACINALLERFQSP